MARLFIANDVSAVDRNIAINGAFYPQYERMSDNGTFAVFYEKKIYSLGNIFRDGTGNFIGIVGTYLYKEHFGVEAAKRILEDFDGDITRMKKDIQGMYSAFVVKNGQTVIFNDYYGLYDTYYYIKGGTYVVGTSLKDILTEVEDIAIEEFPFILEVFHTGCFDRATSFKNVMKLVGSDYLVLSQDGMRVCSIAADDYKIVVPSPGDMDEAVGYVARHVSYYAGCVARNFRHIALGMTGGLDSRTVLGAYSLNRGDTDITMYYGRGNSLLTPTCKEDDEIVCQLSRDFGFPLSYMNWNHPEATETVDWDYQHRLAEKYGFLNKIYAGNRNFFEEIENNVIGKDVFWDFGYFLEACRLREWAENKKSQNFLLSEFLDDYFLNKNLFIYSDAAGFREWVKKIFVNRLQDIGCEDENIPIEFFERLRWNTARYSDSRLYMLMNDFTYSYPLFSVPIVHETILNLPVSFIRGAQFQIALLQKLDARMLSLPIFSHRRRYHIEADGTKSMDMNIKNMATKMLQKFPTLSKPVLDIYRRIKYKDYSSNYEKVQLQLSSLLHGDMEHIVDISHYPKDGSITVLYALRQFLIAYNLVTKEGI